MPCTVSIPDAITTLEASRDHRVLRRVDHHDLEGEGADGGLRVGLALDVETTGLDPSRDAIIELAARLFWATHDGRIIAVGPSRSWLEDPGHPLSPEVSKLTGLSDEDLASRRIDDASITEMMVRADFIVAHNASFDRPFVERRFPRCAGYAWCCSLQEIDWFGHGFDGRGLGWLLAQCGQFHDGHRAAADVDATLALLRHVLPNGRTALAELLDSAETPGWMITAVGAHFDVREALKGRGYRWNPESKFWRREVADAALAEETTWLALNVYRPEFRPRADGPATVAVTWRERFSSRL